jgi:hypothetical protein
MDDTVPTIRPAGPQLDVIWYGHKTGQRTTIDAVAQVRALIDVTEAGALEMLDHAVRPSLRYAPPAGRPVRPAAAWILVCDAGHLPTSTTYATEAAAREVLAEHTAGCAGGHTVHLVSPVPGRELVQA